MFINALLSLGYASVVMAHAGHEQEPISGPHQSLWYSTLPGDGGTQVGIQTTRESTGKLLTRSRRILYFLVSQLLDACRISHA